MTDKKYNPKQLKKLNNPERLQTQSPDLIWNTLNTGQPSIMVDIGAGTGFFAVPFADKVEKAIIYACDSSDVMIGWMQENLSPKYADRIIPLKCGESTIPLESNLADLVYMINLHHELDDPLAMLKEAMRLLKTGGKVLVVDWKPVESPSGPPLEIRIPIDMIKQQFEKAGLKDVKDHDVLPYHSLVVGIKV